MRPIDQPRAALLAFLQQWLSQLSNGPTKAATEFASLPLSLPGLANSLLAGVLIAIGQIVTSLAVFRRTVYCRKPSLQQPIIKQWQSIGFVPGIVVRQAASGEGDQFRILRLSPSAP